ncbi:low molecular weight phosphotyrosine protein phosphatase [bacterium SCSIO 12643]|nr:low molecular weight phosphotyrosine protein phosphatase [bacterium SCSIO 12643]
MKSVMFVCLGNICRSPMAHGIFRDKAQKKGLKVHIESSGTSGFHVGEHADPRSISTLRSKGIDILDLRSRKFDFVDFKDYDFIFTMDQQNQSDVLRMAKAANSQNTPEMIMNLSHPGENISVPDPYYGGTTGFEDVYQMLDESLDVLIEKIENLQ